MDDFTDGRSAKLVTVYGKAVGRVCCHRRNFEGFSNVTTGLGVELDFDIVNTLYGSVTIFQDMFELFQLRRNCFL